MAEDNLNWRDDLPDDLKGNESLANFEDVGSMAKSYVELKSYQGASVHIPGEDAGEDAVKEINQKILDKVPGVMIRPDMENAEQATAFYRSAGMPEKSDGYDAPEIEGMKEGLKQDDARLTFFRETAHKHGLNKQQFAGVMKDVIENDMAGASAKMDTQKTELAALDTEWGAASAERKEAARKIAEKTGAPEGLLKAFDANNLPADLVKWLHGLSVSIGTGEGNAHNNNDEGKTGTMTPGEAKEKIQEIYNNKAHPFHKGDAEAMKKMVELVSLADPTASTDPNQLRQGVQFG